MPSTRQKLCFSDDQNSDFPGAMFASRDRVLCKGVYNTSLKWFASVFFIYAARGL